MEPHVKPIGRCIYLLYRPSQLDLDACRIFKYFPLNSGLVISQNTIWLLW